MPRPRASQANSLSFHGAQKRTQRPGSLAPRLGGQHLRTRSQHLVAFKQPAKANPVAYLIELLAAIPSVVYGLWGIFVLIPATLPFQKWLASSLGWNSPIGPGLFSAMVLLAIMIIPFIAAISRDVIKLVPNDQREAAFALGATR